MSFSVVYEFGPFVLDVRRRVLLRDSNVVRLAPKAFEILVALVRQSGEVLDKDELLQAVWPDVVVEENNLAVNIWALRKALGDDLRDHRYIVTIPGRGYSFVAGVARPPEAGSVPELNGLSPARPEKDLTIASLAVLPFTVLSLDARDDYLGIGIADVLITKLSRLRQMVRPTTAVAGYQPANADPLKIGRKLGVDALLVGIIRRHEERVRVTAQLLRVRDGVTLWGDVLDGTVTDLFAVEDSISSQLVEVLTLSLSREERHQLTKRYTNNTEAYQAYLKGRYCWNKRTEEGCRKGIDYFDRAIRSDPSYALAYVGLADCSMFLGLYNALAPADVFPKAIAAATRALEIDTRLAETHASLAYAHLWYHWDCAAAAREFDIAVRLNPNYAIVHVWYSDYCVVMRHFDDALAAIRRAEELDPVSLVVNANIAEILYYARQYDSAREQLCRTIELDPHFPTAHYLLGLTLEQQGDHSGAVSELEIATVLTQRSPFILAALGHAYGTVGRRQDAERIIAELKQLSSQRYVSPYDFALVSVSMGNELEVLQWLERAYRQRAPWLAWLNVEPRFDDIRFHRAFVDLVERVALSAC